ncbi:unnamed protein product [Choristocarpus tenellus]
MASLAEKMDDLKVATDTFYVTDSDGNVAELSVAAAEVNKSGVSSLEPIAGGLKKALTSSDKEKILEALNAVTHFIKECPAAEPHMAAMLPELLQAASHKQSVVQKAATTAVEAFGEKMSPNAVASVLPVLFSSMEYHQKWQTRSLALKLIARFGDNAAVQLGYSLPEVVPAVTPCMSDTKKQVKVAATEAMTAACDVIGNRDMEHMTSDIVKAVINPAEVPEIMHGLAGVAFVQSVESPALAMVVPLLLRGLRVNETATKRQSSVIIENMSKLVDEPADAAPFLPLLMPALEKAAATIADPEARGVADRAYAQLMRLDGLCKTSTSKKADLAKVTAAIREVLPSLKKDDFIDVSVTYISGLCSSLMNLKKNDPEEWKEINDQLSVLSQDVPDGACDSLRAKCLEMMVADPVVDDDEDAEELCNCQFTLAYGTKILLHNTQMKLKRGKKYGLLGGNDSGKTTLMRAIANGSLEGFPDASEVRTVFVEADIQGEQSHLSCVDYVLQDERIVAAGIERNAVQEILATVGFTDDGKAKPNHAVSTLSGGWRMKLAMARAMLQRADILLLDEPTNHLDVINVAWVKNYLNSLTDVTAIMVSHDSGLLNDCCTHILSIANLKLENFKGNLNEYVAKNPAAKSFFELKATKMKFTFPQPGPIDGVKSKGKALMKMSHCDFTYPGNTVPTLFDISVQVSLSSRVACVGENGAGKSTMIKVLTGEVVPQTGEVWRHPNARVAYLAQHAFHHIENHMTRTPNEYIRWRYANNGEDKESLVKVSMVVTPEEEALQKAMFEVQWTDEESGAIKKAKKSVAELLGGRRQDKSKEYLYEVRYTVASDAPSYLPRKKLEKQGWSKAIKAIDARIAQTTGLYVRPLSSSNVEKHLADCGLAAEFATHTRMQALSGGQKVKVVLAAAMWNQPHILILDEPTNYLDREALGALAGAIKDFQGGVVIISHNNEFVSTVCPEEWVMDSGHLETKGDAGWMERQDEKISDQAVITEVTDAAGNVSKVKAPKKKLSKRDHKAMVKKLKNKIANNEDLDTDEDEFAQDNDLF